MSHWRAVYCCPGALSIVQACGMLDPAPSWCAGGRAGPRRHVARAAETRCLEPKRAHISLAAEVAPPAPARLAGDTSGRLRHFLWVVCTYEHATDNRSLKYGQKPSTSHQLCTMRAPPSTGVVDKKVTFFTRLYTQKKDYTYIVCDLLAAVLDGGTSSGYADNVGEAAER